MENTKTYSVTTKSPVYYLNKIENGIKQGGTNRVRNVRDKKRSIVIVW